MKLQHPQKYAAEMLATFTLTLALSLSLLFVLPLSSGVIAALVVGVFVYTIGGISGAHINPAVTLGMWIIKQINTKDALLYVVAQFVGAGLATMLVLSMTTTIPMVGTDSPQIILGEAIGAFILTFGVAAVALGKAKEDAAGLVVGGSLLVGILVASSLSSGILNPAVAFGLGTLSLSYLIGPLLGGVLGAITFRWISS
jgi:glycerol uptake facilitator protein